ncbi:glycosyltransferase [Curtobacterium sp. NPDC087080]|uniref:glycosyltransferase family protein n=1 Tax=Curtobacterium sp. NPDC087080 TaxID=3363965 RepID=UPI00382B9A41
MRVLVLGDMSLGRNARSVREGFAHAGFDVRSVSTARVVHASKGSSNWWYKRRLQQVAPAEQRRFDAELTSATTSWSPDLTLAIKTIHHDQTRILELPGRKAHLSFDDVSNPENTSPRYLMHESEWDLIVTTKRHNVPELYSRGARDVLYIWGAFDPRYRHRTTSFEKRHFKVGFIGAARPDRVTLPSDLATHVRGDSIVYGPRWRRSYPLGKRGVSLRPLALREKYTAAANSMQIGLVLLNSDNRDAHTNRTFETPATGQLLVGERTSEHLELFDEGSEAFFFEDRDELWDLIPKLVRDQRTSSAVASNGWRKMIEGPYTYADRAREIAAHLDES